MRDSGFSSAPANAGDGINTIEWIRSGWIQRGFDPSAPGQTDVMYEQAPDGSWFIKEADIYLNGEQNTWDLTGETQSSAWSVRSVVLHEGGHAIGILHPCELEATSTVPACDNDPTYVGLAMNPTYSPTLMTLSADDAEAACSVYPKGLCVDRVCLETETCTGAGCRLTCGHITCDLGQVCNAGRCTDPSNQPQPIEGDISVDCTDTSECRRGLSCVSGMCQGGIRKLGDECQQDEQCQDGICTSNGYCAEACQLAGECTEANATCDELLRNVGACIGVAKPMGSYCDTADDCIGKECLVDGARAPVCTRACDEVAVPCPSGWDCVSVEGKNVCVTTNVDDGCGCRLERGSRQSQWVWVLSLLALAPAILRRGRGGSRRVA
jgi:hypothetical protein